MLLDASLLLLRTVSYQTFDASLPALRAVSCQAAGGDGAAMGSLSSIAHALDDLKENMHARKQSAASERVAGGRGAQWHPGATSEVENELIL